MIMLNKIEWEAEEYIIRERHIWWYVGLFISGVVLSLLAGFFQQWTFLVLIILSVITILVSTLKPPKKIKYSLDKNGLKEGSKSYKYEDFKAFGILKEGGNFSIILIPKKRLGMQIKVYFPEKNGEVIVDTLGAKLPMEDVKLDLLDKIVNFLRI